MQRRSGCVLIFGLAFSMLSLNGCNSEGRRPRPPMARVKGTVTYKGEPVSEATVSFIMDGMPRGASGTTDDEGQFKLTTYDTNDGAFVGTHKVTVTKVGVNSLGKAMEDLTPEDLLKLTKEKRLDEVSGKKQKEIPSKYSDVKTTPLKFTIETGSNDKPIELED